MQNTLRIIVLGLVCMAITFVFAGIGWNWNISQTRFMLLAVPLLVSELFIMLSFAGFTSCSTSKLPLRAAALYLPWGYFFYTLLLMLCAPVSVMVIVVWQLAGVGIASIVLAFTMMVAHSVKADSEAQTAAFAPRKNMRLQMSVISAVAESKFKDSPDIMQDIDKCNEALRFIADSPATAQGADDEAMEKLGDLESAVAASDGQKVKECVDSLLIALKKRETIIKLSR